MRVIPDFKTVKFVQEFKKAFGRKAKPPKSTMKLLVETLSSVVSGPATSVKGHSEEGLIVKVMSSATGERIIHHIQLGVDLAIVNHHKQKIGEPDNSTTVGVDDLWIKTKPRAATNFRDSDVVRSKKSLHSE